MVAGIVAGAVLLGTGYGALAQAAEMNNNKDLQSGHMMERGHKGQPPQMNAEEAAKHIHDTFGVDENQVKKAINEKKDFRDIGQAAMLAKRQAPMDEPIRVRRRGERGRKLPKTA